MSDQEQEATSDQAIKPPMEVHHHPKHEKKRFSSYLLEGLMIFVAVSMGFLAENIREIINNKEKEHAYMASFLRDLRRDSAELQYTIDSNMHKVAILDSLMLLAGKDMSTIPNRAALYNFSLSVVSYYCEFKSSDATYLQLTNADGLRLIKTAHVADSIAKYAAALKGVYGAEGLYANATDAATNAAHQVLDYSILYNDAYYSNHQLTSRLIPLITSDPEKLKLLYNKIFFERIATENYIKNLELLQPFLRSFVAYIEKEYPHTDH